MKRIIIFELKKILKKKILWITFMVCLILQLFLTSASYIMSSRYVDGKFLETKAEWFKTDRRNAENLSGRKIDDILLSEIEESKKYIPVSGDERESYEYLSSDNYNKKVRPYEGINRLVQFMLADGIEKDASYTPVTQKILYSARHKGQEKLWDSSKLSDSEKEYWQKKEEKLPDVFTYKYGGTFENIVDMSGCYYICMFVIFFIAICITGIFTDEHIRRTDQLILCTKYGRIHSYIAKIFAGCIITTCMALILWIVTFICFNIIYGIGDFSAMVQVAIASLSLYPGNITIGQAAVIMTLLLFISSLMLSIITMVLSELLNSSTGTMAIIIVTSFFLARLVMMPEDFKFLYKIWNMIPINLLKADQGFFNIHLWNIFGIKFTLWQMAFVIYIIIGLIFFFIGKRKYCKYQISGR